MRRRHVERGAKKDDGTSRDRGRRPGNRPWTRRSEGLINQRVSSRDRAALRNGCSGRLPDPGDDEEEPARHRVDGALCAPDRVTDLSRVLFEESPTIGVRWTAYQ